jgi:hypothetical protein
MKKHLKKLARRPAEWLRRGAAIVLFCSQINDAASAAVPGVVIDHCPASSGLFIGSPSLVALPNGCYLASHDFFGPRSGSTNRATTLIFRSENRGATWHEIALIHGACWANLFTHGGAAYLMGVEKEHGRIVIRRSRDSGLTWSEPDSAASGLLTPGGQYHTAPLPMAEKGGRLWRAFENSEGGVTWGSRLRAGMLSVPEEADLLNATNWTFSEFLPHDPEWLGGNFGAWLEGNAVVAPDGNMVDVLRVDTPGLPEKAAIAVISEDGRRMTFDPARDCVDFPGGSKKFTIRFDAKSQAYWALATLVLPQDSGAGRPADVRNTLALVRSPDLRHWEVRAILLHDRETKRHGFQYADWQFEGDDIIAVVRTAFDDAEGGAHSYHDANFLTFHRWRHFRGLATHRPVRENPGVK